MPSEMTCGSVVDDKTPLPPLGTTEEEEFILLQDEAYIYGPIKVDYGTILKYVRQPLGSQPKLIGIGSAKASTSTATARSSIPA
jgi:hypothetical protein